MTDTYNYMAWMRSHIGEPFETGLPPTAFNRMVFSHTNTPLGRQMLAGCAATVSAALELNGWKSAHSAAAHDCATIGHECDARYGAVCVIEHLTGDLAGHFHVGFIEHFDGISVTLLGGNQGHELCLATFDLTFKNRIVATRQPELI